MPAERPAAVASEWIAASPPLLAVLDWHVDLCPGCVRGRPKCAEFREILAEYGAGPSGSAVFFP